MTNKFCEQLSNGYSFSSKTKNELTLAPCCWYRSSIPFDENYLSTRKKTFELVTEWTSNCSACKEQEMAGNQSLRNISKDWIPESNLSDPYMIDINLDIECNAACVTCGQHSSTLWGKEKAKVSNIKYIKNITSPDQHIDKIVNTLNLTKLTYVKFFGGEPLFTDTHLKFIKHIPYPESVTLHYTTNGSIYPNDEVLSAWKKFKVVIFATSLDGIEEQFDYVRWPLPWSKVSNNLLKLKSQGPYNLMFRVEFTANFLNAYYFDRLENWVAENFSTNRVGDKTEINIHNCWGGTWDLTSMPVELRELMYNKYPTNHSIHKIIKSLPLSTSLSNWKNFVKQWDSIRENSWKTAFPDLVEYINYE